MSIYVCVVALWFMAIALFLIGASIRALGFVVLGRSLTLAGLHPLSVAGRVFFCATLRGGTDAWKSRGCSPHNNDVREGHPKQPPNTPRHYRRPGRA